MATVVHFEILAGDLKRASKFYQSVFGWKVEGWGPQPYLLVTTRKENEPGINGAIMPRAELFDAKGEGFRAYVCTVEIPDIDKTRADVEKAGGELVTGKNVIPNVGVHSYCRDTEGNIFGIMQSLRP